MKRITVVGASLGACLALSLAMIGTASADHHEGHGMPIPIKVGAEHELLHKFVGEWDVVQKVWMGPGEPQEMRGKQTCRKVMDGLGIAFDYKNDKGFVGSGFQTWAPKKKKYESFWADSFSHGGMSHGWGTYDAKSKTIKETMTSVGPDGKSMEVESETVMTSDDTHVMTMYAKMQGKRVKVMELTYTRAKAKK